MDDLIKFVGLSEQDIEELCSMYPCISTGENTYIPKDCYKDLQWLSDSTLDKMVKI
jgi:hypothetical protein